VFDRSQQLDRLVSPSRIAVVGASPRAGWGLKTIENLQEMGFQGEICPVNPRYEEVAGYQCYPRLADLPTAPDVAVFAIPAEAIPQGVAEAIEVGIPAAVVYASGFGASGQGEGGEVGEEGLRQRLSDLCQGQIAVLGPNCLGVINYARRSASYGITMPFAHVGTEQGIALVAQSGNMALTASNANRGIAFTHLISCGNQLDVTVAELLGACLRDPAVRVLAAIVEGILDPARFEQVLAAAAEMDVPVVVLKVGDSERGKVATIAHTGTLSGSAAMYRAFFRQHGAIQVNDLEELIAVAALMPRAVRPRGRGVAVFASSGGECALISDVAESVGLMLPDLPPAVSESITGLLPSYGRASNPLDITAGGWGDAELYANVVDNLSRIEGLGAIVSVADAPTVEGSEMAQGFGGIIDGLIEGKRRLGGDGPTVALLTTISDVSGPVPRLATAGGVVPLIGLRSGLLALAKAGWYVTWREEQSGSGGGKDGRGALGVDGARGSRVAGLLATKPAGAMTEDDAKHIFADYGIATPARALVFSEDEAAGAAREIGYPVVMKVAAPGVLHKTEMGGVLVGLRTDDDVRKGAQRLLALGGSIGHRETGMSHERVGILVEQFVPGGIELIIGGRRDEVFGPAVMVGLGGVLTEVLGDVTHRMAPVSCDAARAMIDELSGRALLDGFRGAAGVDVEALIQVIVAVSQLLEEQQRIVELDINPIVNDVETGFLVALDGLIVLS
jgi:acetyltransferase